jgi:NADP-dependent 3-hydroxy acid dehydrogenase YdfG
LRCTNDSCSSKSSFSGTSPLANRSCQSAPAAIINALLLVVRTKHKKTRMRVKHTSSGPSMRVSGVRNSCEMLEKKSVFARSRSARV